jgi:hypothetical protein
VSPSITSVSTTYVPKAAAVSSVPTTAVSHICAGIMTNIPKARTRTLALLWSSSLEPADNPARSQCGASKAITIRGTVARIAPPVVLRSTSPIRCGRFLPRYRLTIEQAVPEKPSVGIQNTMKRVKRTFAIASACVPTRSMIKKKTNQRCALTMRVKRMSETTKEVAVVQHRLHLYKKASAISQERVEATFRILLADEHVRAVLINIFGGIVRCDMVARGVVDAAKDIGVQVPARRPPRRYERRGGGSACCAIRVLILPSPTA